MTRLAPLLLVVLALAAAVPAAFADDSTPPAPTTTTTTTAPTGSHPFARLRLDILRLRLRLVRLEYRVACHDATSDRCAQFTQKLVSRLANVETAVEKKLTALDCSSSSTDRRCSLLVKLDAKLKDVLQELQSGAAPSTTDESGLDSAASSLAAG